jgi:ATP-binding cassette subfamily B protein
LLSGLIGVGQRYLGANIGEGLIADLRQALYAHMERMSLRFFTHTKTGELMSRLNNDVVGAQRAVTGTFIDIITNIVALVTTLAIMFSLEWRLTLLSIAIFPLFVLPARRV